MLIRDRLAKILVLYVQYMRSLEDTALARLRSSMNIHPSSVRLHTVSLDRLICVVQAQERHEKRQETMRESLSHTFSQSQTHDAPTRSLRSTADGTRAGRPKGRGKYLLLAVD